ncbi:hypothetical protein NPIL_451221 [Nephila pilipes]|uniref:Uncharacterized protein n=1 Tax=Nephila pilipes TaxID=299642 RepID=A0A8X6TFH3_NEPPI|nr:hypothetical protein NPIL_451221 [Nephila pilipes]
MLQAPFKRKCFFLGSGFPHTTVGCCGKEKERLFYHFVDRVGFIFKSVSTPRGLKTFPPFVNKYSFAALSNRNSNIPEALPSTRSCISKQQRNLCSNHSLG